MKKGHSIKSINASSIAEELGLGPGDRVMTIGDQELGDTFDYQYYINSEAILMVVMKANDEEWELKIESDYKDLSITFENGLMSKYRSCRNKYIFCFIDQMPKGMRGTLYFKDDGSRLLFLQGNCVTLTNMSSKGIKRIIQFKLTPINIPVQTTNPKLQYGMPHNRSAGEALKKIDTLYKAETPMNGQIVLCKGVNNRNELERSIRDLPSYTPRMEGVPVVPAGLSRFRGGLYPLEPITAEDVGRTIDIIEKRQKRIYREHGIRFIHASGEFYVLASRPLPKEERYDDYIQLESGVGMLRLLETEVAEALAQLEDGDPEEEVSMVTGALTYAFVEQHLSSIREKFPSGTIHLYRIINRFFGTSITVAGLITGQDLISQLEGKDLGSRLLLPICMFRSREEVFLDDVTLDEVKTALQVPVSTVKSNGQDLVTAVPSPEEDTSLTCKGYKPKRIPKA